MIGGLFKEGESLAKQGNVAKKILQDQFSIQDEMILTLTLSGERCQLWALT